MLLPRTRLLLASVLVLVTAACGGDAAIDAATEDQQSSVRIEIDDATPLPEPVDPVAPASAVTVGSGQGLTSAPTSGGVETAPVTTTAPTATAETATSAQGPSSSPPKPTSSPSSGSSTAPQTGSATDARSSVVAQAVVSRITARVEPSEDAAPVASLAHPTPVGSPLVFLAVDGSAPIGWLEVRLPVQPNGTTGWVRRDEVTLFENPYRIEIDRAEHRLQVLHLGQPWMETAIAVGTGATPTPVGDFYLLELLAPPDPTGPYGPYAFGLSGFSEVLDSFGGADAAIIGLHGTDQPEALGTDVSFGCIRLANEVMSSWPPRCPSAPPVRIT